MPKIASRLWLANNRTTLELKHGIQVQRIAFAAANNRTTLELKQVSSFAKKLKSSANNRTTLELKLQYCEAI